MNINSSQFRTAPQSQLATNPSTKQESFTFGPDLDPFSGVKDGFRRAGEGAGNFLKGAAPGIGAYTQLNESFDFFSGFTGGGLNLAGAGLNAAGTISLAVAGFQALSGADPTTALMLGAGGLATAGLANTIARATD